MTSLLSSSSFRRLKSESSSRSYCFFLTCGVLTQN
jgi:hypothetical protein